MSISNTELRKSAEHILKCVHLIADASVRADQKMLADGAIRLLDENAKEFKIATGYYENWMRVQDQNAALVKRIEGLTQGLKCPKCGAHNAYDIERGKISAFDWLTKHPCGPMELDDA